MLRRRETRRVTRDLMSFAAGIGLSRGNRFSFFLAAEPELSTRWQILSNFRAPERGVGLGSAPATKVAGASKHLFPSSLLKPEPLVPLPRATAQQKGIDMATEERRDRDVSGVMDFLA